MVIELTDKNFEKEVLNSDIPVLVDFWAPWCQHCLMMVPILEELSTELKGILKIAKVNVDAQESLNLAIKYEIQSLPNMKLIKKGKVVKEIIGAYAKENLKRELKKEIEF
jgi:thioredoxin 1